jgi:hypothetical protein
VLLCIEEYRRITGGHQKIADLLAMPGIEDVEFEIPQLSDLARPAHAATHPRADEAQMGAGGKTT